jgi:hypothetical protein
MLRSPIHPIDIPIQSPNDAEIALSSMEVWKPAYDTDRDLIADRALEILAYRLSQAWQAFKKTNPEFPEVIFKFYSSRGMEWLFASSWHCPSGTRSSIDEDIQEFSNTALFGGDRNTNIVGKAFRRRFGHVSMNWPSLCPSDGIDAVLHALIKPAHRMRREALILDQSTATCEAQRHAPRL